MQLEPVPVRELVDELVAPYREALAGAVTFECHVPEELPPMAVDRALTVRALGNLVENALRPSCIGKKNGLFIGHPDAGQRSAILYSLIVSCQRHGKDPLAYLRDLLTRLPRMTNQDDLSPLTPSRWQPLA